MTQSLYDFNRTQDLGVMASLARRQLERIQAIVDADKSAAVKVKEIRKVLAER